MWVCPAWRSDLTKFIMLRKIQVEGVTLDCFFYNSDDLLLKDLEIHFRIPGCALTEGVIHYIKMESLSSFQAYDLWKR